MRGMWRCPAAAMLTLGFCLLRVTAQDTTTGGPYIMTHPRNMTAVEGQRVLFNCGAEAFPDNITYYWYKDNKDVRQLPVYNKRLTLTEGKLLLTGVVKEDMGWYTCRPSNGIGQDEASAYLNVTYFPRVIVKSMPVQVRWATGFREKLDCPVDANPPMTETLWTKGQTILDSRGRFDVLLNGTLLVSGVEEGDAGSYFCTPVSALGQGQPSPNVQVIVRDPPYFTIRPNALYQRQVAQSVVLPCAASGTPEPSIVWRKVGGFLDLSTPRVRQQGGNLTITSTVKEDHGKYECVASTTIATIVSPTELKILNTTPHAPYNVTVVPGLFSAHISWDPAYDGGKPQFYMLWFRQVGGNWGQLTIPGESTDFTMYNLLPDTNYEFMVLSRNELGNGSYSEIVGAKTLGYQPGLATALPTDSSGVTYIPDVQKPLGPQPTPPRNVTAVVRNDNSVLLTWLPSLNPIVPVFWYVVDYRQAGTSIWRKYDGHVLQTAGTRMEMEGLEPGTYEIRVVAYGVLAFSVPSNIVTVNIPDEGRLIPDAMIGGIVGGVLFLLVAVLLTTMAIIHSRRKDSKSRNGGTNYADVSYGKPEDMNSKLQQTPPKRDRWQQNGGGDLVTSLSNTDSIFFLPRSHDPHLTSSDLHPTASARGHYDLYERDPSPYRNDPGFQVTRSPPLGPAFRDHGVPAPGQQQQQHQQKQQHYPHSPLSYQRSQPLTFDDTQPLVTARPRPRSRSQPSERSHRFPSDPYDPRSPRPREGEFAYPGYPLHHGYPGPYLSGRRSSRDRSSSPPPHSHSHSQQRLLPPSQPPPPYRSSGGSGGDDYPPKPSRTYDGPQRAFDDGPPPPHRGYNAAPRGYDGPQRGYDGPFQSFQSEDDDVFPLGSQAPLPPPSSTTSGSRPGTLPRHSTMKPGSQQTYLTEGGGEDGEGERGEEAPAFTLSDISSVLDPPQDVQQQQQQQHSPGLPPPRRSWQPSQESSRSFQQPPSYYGSADDGSWDRGRDRDRDGRPLARVWPSPKTADDSSDSSGRPLGYTRDQLHDVVDRLRHAPRSRSAPGDRYLDVSSAQGRGGSSAGGGGGGGGGGDLRPPSHYSSQDGSDPSRPGAGAGQKQPHHQQQHPHQQQQQPLGGGGGYGPHPHYPEDSPSSGIGSRNTSQSTSGSLRPRTSSSTTTARPPHGGINNNNYNNNNSLSSLLTPHESSLAEDSSSHHHPFLDPASYRRDTSADENYEFDHLPALESDILDDLHRYSQLAGSGQGQGQGQGHPTGDVMRELYPKPRRQSQYADAAERFQKLREEFQQFRQQQQEAGSSPSYAGPQDPLQQQYRQQQQLQQRPLYPMDSEML